MLAFVAFVLASCDTPTGRVPAVASPSPFQSPSTSPSSSVAASCVAPTPVDSPEASPPPQPTPPLPRNVRINTARGANVRAEPSLAAVRIGFLPQDTPGRADRASTDSSGAQWYRVTTSGLTGWIRGDLLIDEPAYYSGWGAWSVVAGSRWGYSGGMFVDFQDLSDPSFWWMLIVRVAPTASSLPPPSLEWGRLVLHPELYERSEPVSVWKYTVTKRVARASFDSCDPTQLARARNGSWPYVTVVEVVTDVRAYQFLFATPDPDSSVVRKLIDSINISE